MEAAGVDEVYLPVFNTEAFTNGEMDAAIGAVQDAGLRAVPHLPTRRLTPQDRLAAVTLLAQRDVGKVLIIGGDTDTPVLRSYDSSLEFIRTDGPNGEDPGSLPSEIALAVHPEGHQDISDEQLAAVLAEKEAFIKANPDLSINYIMQMMYNADNVRSWAKSNEITTPTSIGFSIPAGWFDTLKYAKLCGMEKVFTELKDKGLARDDAEAFMQIVLENPQQFSPHLYAFGGLNNIVKFLGDSREIQDYATQQRS